MHISDLWRKIILALAVLVFVILMFQLFVQRNEQRILEQNAAFVAETAEHTMEQVDLFLDRAQDSLATIGYLLERDMTSPQVDESILPALLDMTSFSYIGFVDSEGLNHSLREEPVSVADRDYFHQGMRGLSGMQVLMDSRATVDPIVVLFYTPVRYEDEIVGILVGYFERERLEQTLHTTYFGEQASSYLCLPGGTVIADSIPENGSAVNNILESYYAMPEVVGEEGVKQLTQALQDKDSFGITYQGVNGIGNAYVTNLSDHGLVLFQTVPSRANTTIMENANRSGIYLEAGLVMVFLIYIVFLLINDRFQRRAIISEKDQELQYRDQLFSLLSQNSEDIYVLCDLDSLHTEYVSPNIQRLIGLEPEVVKNDLRALMAVMAEGRALLSVEEMKNIPVGDSREMEINLLHQETKERRWYRETLYHADFQGGDRYVLALSDRTRDQKMKETLENALEAARTANEAKSNFLANMSHDIRTPMNAIVGFSMLLNKDADDPEKVREYTQKISASSQHLLSLINDVLDMSKIESGKTSLTVVPFSVPELLDRVNTIIAPQARAKKQDYEMHLKGEVPELLLGDELRIVQILVNLLSNAVKYTDVGGKILFLVQRLERASAGSARLRFVIQDNGMGMSEEFLGKIFDPFVRETNSVVNSIQGTGLGMPITKNLVDLMGGTIDVKSVQGEGSTFTVELEFSVPEQLRTKEFWELNRISRALVVDDEEDICLTVQAQMADTGVEVDYATDGETAVAKSAEAYHGGQGYDVILLDWKMPGMDGVETAKRIRGYAGEDVPILVLTAFDWSEIESDARAAGINAFLAKPFFRSNFQHTIQTLRGTEQTAIEETPLEGMHFLIAEDNEINAEILEEMLSMVGATCERACDGQEAFEMFGRSEPGKYDMILMDVQMPIMNGYAATQAIRGSDHPLAKTIPVVAMTANAFAEDVKNAMDAGMDAHVAKPVDLDEVIKILLRLKKDGRE